MKKIATLSSLLLGVVFLAGCGQEQTSQTQSATPAPAEQQTIKNPQQSSDLPVAKSVSLQAYRNDKLGFEINIPKKVDDGPIKTIESGDALWIVAENSSYIEELKQFNSSVSDFKKVAGIPWAILVKTVNNDQELNQFIKDRYGKDCSLGQKQPSSQPGIFDVQIDTGDGEAGEGCFLNWILFIKYSPEQNKVAAWDMGQDARFYSSEEVNVDGADTYYDQEMAESFKFIK
jgi:LysM repeat protein